jgi:hypothetical protein
MNMNRLLCAVVVSLVALTIGVQSSHGASWNEFVILNSNVGGVAPAVAEVGTDGVTASILLAGQKAGYGTPDADGSPVSSLVSLSYTRNDAGTSDPYLNIWVTDGVNSAVIAPVVGMVAGGGYSTVNINGVPLQTLGFNIYETNFGSLNWLVPGAIRSGAGLMHADNTPVLISEIGSLLIDDPNPTYSRFEGTGAPKNNTGFNIIFGDTGNNFTSAIPYSLSNVTLVPEPTSFCIIGGTLIAFACRRRTL